MTSAVSWGSVHFDVPASLGEVPASLGEVPASLGEEGRGLCHLLALAGDGGTAALISGRQMLPVSQDICKSFIALKTLSRHCGGRGLL